MVDSHNKSFFGKSVGMILNSNSMTEQNIFLTFIKKKPDGSWEKPSNREGKNILINLEEIVWFLEVLKRRTMNWSTIHKFGGSSTKIAISWVKDQKEQDRVLIQANGYSKAFNHAETIILTKLLKHLLEEKIIHATVSGQESAPSKEEVPRQVEKKKVTQEKHEVVVEEVVSKKEPRQQERGDVETVIVSGAIRQETEKALRIIFENEKEGWVAKSKIHSPYSLTFEVQQPFEIEKWALEKNNLL